MSQYFFKKDVTVDRVNLLFKCIEDVSKDMESLMNQYARWMIRDIKLTNYEGEDWKNKDYAKKKKGDGKEDRSKGFVSFSPIYRYDKESDRKIIYELRWGRISYLDRTCKKRPIYGMTYTKLAFKINRTNEKNKHVLRHYKVINEYIKKVNVLNQAQSKNFEMIQMLRKIFFTKPNQWIFDVAGKDSFEERMETYPRFVIPRGKNRKNLFPNNAPCLDDIDPEFRDLAME